MSLCEWIKNLFGKEEKAIDVPIKYEVVSFTTSDGNYVQGEWFSPEEPNDDAIIYCGGGFGGAVTPDYKIYVRAGFRLLHIDLEGEGGPATSDPNRDIIELKDAVSLLRDKLGVTGNIYFVGVSKGGYAVTLTFGYHPNLVKKMVNYMGPINMYDPPYDWTVWGATPKHKGLIDAAKAYFAKTKDPYTLAKEGKYAGLGDRMLLLYGKKDPVCPYKTMLIPFNKKTGCKGMVFPGLSHNVHRNASAQQMALRWLKK